MKNIIYKDDDKDDDKILHSLIEKEKNINKVVNRYMRIRVKKGVRKLTGIKI